MDQWKIHICSENNFPTSAGLASSAAGYACLVVALAKLYEIKVFQNKQVNNYKFYNMQSWLNFICFNINFQGDITTIARVGSGSACRSILGGFVRWYMGSQTDGTDSIAKQIVPASYWPEMRILILVVSIIFDFIIFYIVFIITFNIL